MCHDHLLESHRLLVSLVLRLRQAQDVGIDQATLTIKADISGSRVLQSGSSGLSHRISPELFRVLTVNPQVCQPSCSAAISHANRARQVPMAERGT